MAKIYSEELVITFSKLIKESGIEHDATILTPEIKEAIAMLVVPMIEEVLGDSAVVEVK